jgi:hypothetical protein
MSLEGMSQDQIEALAALSKSIADNPKTRLQFQALVKTAHPDATTPELDGALAIRELAQQRQKDKEEFDQYKAEQEARNSEMREWAEVVGAGECTYNDIPEVQKFMTDNGIMNKAFGAKSWSQSRSLAEPSSAHTRTFEMPSTYIDKLKAGGLKGFNQWAKDEAYIALNEIRSGKAS